MSTVAKAWESEKKMLMSSMKCSLQTSAIDSSSVASRYTWTALVPISFAICPARDWEKNKEKAEHATTRAVQIMRLVLLSTQKHFFF
jgi:hypothetical protein